MEYEGIVLDLDGTVYRGDELIPGVADAVEALRARDIRPLFFSNNPTKSRDEYVDSLTELGVDAAVEEVLSAGTVTTRFLTAEHDGDAVFVVGSDGLKRQFRAAGLRLVADATQADVLVASYDRQFSYGKLLAGYRALANGATFYGTDPDMLIPAPEGMVPGSGAILNAIGGVADTQPAKVLGKPSAEAQRAALDALDASGERCLVVGDRLDTDIALGRRAGMTTVLVRTGVTTDADLETSDVQPDHVIDSLSDIETVLG